MPAIRLLGLRISVYTRIARLALEEKRVDYTLEEVDIFADEGPPADYLARNPFGTIPCLVYGDFTLYETSAITHYIEESFTGPRLQPDDPRQRARMNQIIHLLDSYGYRPMVWDIYVQRVVIAASGGQADEATIQGAIPIVATVLDQLQAFRGDGPWLLGEQLTLADLHAYPMLRYLAETDEGKQLLDARPGVARWLRKMARQPSVQRTSFHSADGSADGF